MSTITGQLQVGSIPMCMGPPAGSSGNSRLNWVYPHVYGATFAESEPVHCALGLSPCVWGHQFNRFYDPDDLGSIPMCMGPPTPAALQYTLTGPSPHVYVAPSV